MRRPFDLEGVAMTLELTLRTDAAVRLTVSLDGQPLAGPTPLADLPALPALQAAPYDQGRALTQALGGQALLERLQNDAERLLLLETDDAAAAVPWEFAALEGGQLLAGRYGLLRLVDRPGDPAPAPDTLQFVVLAADPLVDKEGRAREGYRLRLEEELRAIRRTLAESQVDLVARRAPPTRDGLRRAMRRGPAVLHLTCHGDVIQTNNGPMAVLLLEDADGGEDRLPGPDLIDLPPRGVLRLILLSACHTARPEAGDAYLARALVQNGVPAAIGMQGAFPDPLSDELAVALYEFLLSGYSLAEALRQARLALDPDAAGLPVGYVARGGWEALPLRAGVPAIHSLRLPSRIALFQDIQAPRRLRGREAQLHALAALYSQGRQVVTVVGSGGIGKTALAAVFARRFGWRWPQGVLGLSFASGELDAARFRDDLLRGLLGEAAARQLADARPDRQEQAILEALPDWDGLLLLDNYESVLQGLDEEEPQATAVHQLVANAANGGAAMLLTSRQQPAGLAGETVFPRPRRPLPGLEAGPGAELFLHHSSRAKEEGQAGVDLAHQVARVTEGHPLAITLLAGEYDVSSDVAPVDFLAGWAEELAQAERHGLAGHHRTFAAAFNRSYERLPAPLQAHLRALSRFLFPFYAQGAALMWGLSTEEAARSASSGQDLVTAREELAGLVRRSLVEVEGWFEDGTPATYRFQPALGQALARRVGEAERPDIERGYAAYGAWLTRRGYGNIHKEPALARLVRLSMEALAAATDYLEGNERLWHIRRLAWLKGAYGQTGAAYDLLLSVLPPGRPAPDAEREPESARVESSLRYELARLCVTRGELERALALYQESLELSEQIGDLQGKTALLHQMAGVYVTRGELERALSLYQESLGLYEQIGDLQGVAASLHNMANILMAQSKWDEAEQTLQESQQLARKVGVAEHLAFAKVKLGQVAQARGDAETALARYREGLTIFERLGMPRETEQVRGMIAALEGDAQPAPQDPLRGLIARARTAGQAGDAEGAVAAGEEAVALARGRADQAQAGGEEEHVALVALSVLLYNLAGYYQQAGRHDDAVAALEEVVALDQRTGHPDLKSDREALEAARHLARLAPEERAQLEALAQTPSGSEDPAQSMRAALEAQLAGLAPEERAQLEAALRHFAGLSPEEQAQELAGMQAATQRGQIEALAAQARDGAIAALRGQTEREPFLAQLEEVAAQAAEGEEPGSPWDELASYLRAVVALLRGQPAPPVPASYAGHMAAIQSVEREA
jgi:tetratricopeptide (TPR) repeat protein